jgi:hypothetical protein
MRRVANLSECFSELVMDETVPRFDQNNCERPVDWGRRRLALWRSFCQTYRVSEESVPLFECDEGGFVLTKEIGASWRRRILQRSSAMEALMRKEAEKVIKDHKAATAIYDGAIYMMHIK